MKYINRSIKDFLKDLSLKTPAPGGGSVAALCLAMAAGLMVMGARFSLGKEKLKKSEDRIKEILARGLLVQERASVLVDEDIKAYKAKDLDRSLKVPAEVCLLSHDTMMLALELMARGNKNLASDVRLSVLLTMTSFISAYSFVLLNFHALRDKNKYDRLVAELKILLKDIKRMGEKAEGCVGHHSRR